MNAKICKAIVTDLLSQMEKDGIVPWRKPYRESNSIGKSPFPQNYISGHVYTGANTLILLSKPYSSLQWLTFKQASDIGGHVRKGEKGTTILFWEFVEKENTNTETGKVTKATVPYLKTYYIWNIDQVEIPKEYLEKRVRKDTEKEQIATEQRNQESTLDSIRRTYPPIMPDILFGGNNACYNPGKDQVILPPKNAFSTSEELSSTLCHEVIHSTGHTSRLARKLGEFFGTNQYSREELIAEIGSYFLCLYWKVDISRIQKNSVAYLSGWFKHLGSNPEDFLLAGSQAQKAFDYIIGTRQALEA